MSSIAPAAPSPLDMMMATGYIVSAAAYATTKIGIPDLLENGPRTIKDLAKATNSNEDALYRTMRALAGVGIFKETSSRVFELTPAAETLRTGAPDSLRDAVLWIADRFHFKIHAELPYAIETGNTVSERVTGLPIFDYFMKDVRRVGSFQSGHDEFQRSADSRGAGSLRFFLSEGKNARRCGRRARLCVDSYPAKVSANPRSAV